LAIWYSIRDSRFVTWHFVTWHFDITTNLFTALYFLTFLSFHFSVSSILVFDEDRTRLSCSQFFFSKFCFKVSSVTFWNLPKLCLRPPTNVIPTTSIPIQVLPKFHAIILLPVSQKFLEIQNNSSVNDPGFIFQKMGAACWHNSFGRSTDPTTTAILQRHQRRAPMETLSMDHRLMDCFVQIKIVQLFRPHRLLTQSERSSVMSLATQW